MAGPEDRRDGQRDDRRDRQGGGRRDDRSGRPGAGDRRPARDDRGRDDRGRDDRGARPARDDRRGPARGDGGTRPYRDDRGRSPRDERGARPTRDDRGGFSHSERGGAGREPREFGVERPRRPRIVEPELGEHLSPDQLDRSARRELKTLSKENADGVALHLLATDEAVAADDLDLALAHAMSAARRAGRVAVVREALGIVHYRRGEWAKALAEFRTARRLSGSDHLLPHMADTERGLGRPERALELAQSPEAAKLPAAERVEMLIVESGARRDLGQPAAAVELLRELARATTATKPWAARVYYAYGEALLEVDREDEARGWFAKAVPADSERTTDAAERLAELDGLEIVDLDEDADDEPADGEPADEPEGLDRPEGEPGERRP